MSTYEAAWRRALAERDQPSVAQIGELSRHTVLPSRSKQISKSTTKLVFTYEAKQSQKFTLYWIDSDGEKHHGYQLEGKQWQHTETTHGGHAFALYVNENTLVCSYRVLAVLMDPQYHLVCVDKLCVELRDTLQEARVIAEMQHWPRAMLSTGNWQVTYSFSVPNVIPRFNSFVANTVYVWGDLSFDEFDFDHEHEVTQCKMNQLVPQVMIGHCLYKSNAEDLKPEWRTFTTWVAQAQYYFQTEFGEEQGSRALCGEYFHVNVGERMESKITFQDGIMHVSIQSINRPEMISKVSCDKPFPCTTSKDTWLEFFAKKQHPSTGEIKSYANFNIEYKADEISLRALKKMCPFKVHSAKFPSQSFTTEQDFLQEWNVKGMNFEAASAVKFGM